jgi:hypothetical protein
MMRRPKRSTIEVVAPKEEEEFAYFSLGGTEPLRFAIYAAVTVNITVLWAVTACASVDRHQRL